MPAHHGKLGPRGVAARHTHAHGRLANAPGRTAAPCDSIYVTFSEDGRKRCHTAWGSGSQGLRRGQDLTREGGSFRSAGGCVPPRFSGRFRDSTTHGTERPGTRSCRCRARFTNENRSKCRCPKAPPQAQRWRGRERRRTRAGGRASGALV